MGAFDTGVTGIFPDGVAFTGFVGAAPSLAGAIATVSATSHAWKDNKLSLLTNIHVAMLRVKRFYMARDPGFHTWGVVLVLRCDLVGESHVDKMRWDVT